MCQRYPGALPEAGGLMDQDYSLMHRMAMLSNTYDVISRMRNMQGAQIHQLTISERKMIRWLHDLELL